MIKRFLKSVFFTRRLYWVLVGIILIFILAYGLPLLFLTGQLLLAGLFLVLFIDAWLLFRPAAPVSASRWVPERMSNGDNNRVVLLLTNRLRFPIRAAVIDELPDQFQRRRFIIRLELKPGETAEKEYTVRPVERGLYVFHNINFFLRSPIGLIQRRVIIPAETAVRTLPSYLDLHKFQLLAHSEQLQGAGMQRVRRLGHSLEFDQIKEYVSGDDIRSINWHATGRHGGQLMVNKYRDEKSQQIYCVIDKGRVMKMPFEGMTLLDYSINAALMLLRVALYRQDKAGLVVFSNQVDDFLSADSKSSQIKAILDRLYALDTRFQETDLEDLHHLVKTRISQRSLLVLFTNFESLSSLQRQLPYLRSMARNHLLLVVFFENTGLTQLAGQPVHDMEGLYRQTIAGKFAFEKKLIVKELRLHGISTILTTPQQLTTDVINRYLELKARLAI